MRHGSKLNPPNRFETIQPSNDLEHVEDDVEFLRSLEHRRIELIEDQSESIVSKNNSPDLNFTYSLNPYRGCIHACAYCYARPTHEYLGFNAGLDFETKIVYKPRAAELFRKFLARKSWVPEPIAFSGVTDCYQPAERKLELTRSCLEVALECKQPINIVTKNALVLRDKDLLSQLAQENLVHIYVSVTTLDANLARVMEPRTSIPSARLRAIAELAGSKIPVGVMIAPVIPGLNDSEIPTIMKFTSDAGADSVGYVVLRLPLTVEPVFEEWIRRARPDQAEMVLGRIRQTRNGVMNDSKFGSRMRGQGPIADQISKLFEIFRTKFDLDTRKNSLNCSDFIRPESQSGQLRLF